MVNYDLVSILSPLDFEQISKDLLEAELKVRLESFKPGKDGGIDLRYTSPVRQRRTRQNIIKSWGKTRERIIIQCKRFATFSSLKSELSKHELPKIRQLRPDRYILTTTVPVSLD